MAEIKLELTIDGIDNKDLDKVAADVAIALRRGLKAGWRAEVSDELDREPDDEDED